jgi:16S rRNA processing protein RimM
VGAPFGIKGFVKVRSLSGEYEHLKKLKQVVLRTEKGEKVYEVEESVDLSGALAMKFKGIETPEAAKVLAGGELVVGREDAAPLNPGEFYVEDLRSMEAVCRGEVVGLVTGVIEGGGGNLVEVRLPSGETRFVPFRNEFVGDINLKTNRLELLNTWILD